MQLLRNYVMAIPNCVGRRPANGANRVPIGCQAGAKSVPKVRHKSLKIRPLGLRPGSRIAPLRDGLSTFGRAARPCAVRKELQVSDLAAIWEVIGRGRWLCL